MPKKHHIKLEPDERARLESILRKGKASAQAQRHARILLLADANNPQTGWNDVDIAAAVRTSVGTVERVRRVCVQYGIEKTLERKSAERQYVRKLDGEGDLHLSRGLYDRLAGDYLDPSVAPSTGRTARWTRLFELRYRPAKGLDYYGS